MIKALPRLPMRISETLPNSMNKDFLIQGFPWEYPRLLKAPPAPRPRYRDWGALHVLGFFLFGTMFRNRTNWENKWGGTAVCPSAAVLPQRP